MSVFKKAVQTAALLVLASSGTAYAYDVQLKPFTDVTDQDWFRNEVYSLSAIGIIDGYSDLTYKPDGQLTREAFIKLLVTAEQVGVDSSGVGTAPIPDVEKGRWSYPFVTAAFERKWIDFLVNEHGLFNPEKVITREEVATIVGKSLLDRLPQEARDRWMAQGWQDEQGKRQFIDGPAFTETLRGYAYYAVNQGVMEGDETGFHPQQSLTRKEAAAIVYRLIEQQTANREIEKTGFYAIRSYPALDRMPLLDKVTFGWSNLAYTAPGKAQLSMTETEYKLPSGWEEAVQTANASGVDKDLMVYYGKSDLQEFLKDTPAQEAFLSSLEAVMKDARYGFTGVTMDLEGLKDSSSAPDYVRLLQALKKAVPAAKLTVAVPPDYYYKGYDLQGIGALADTVILMAYDFTHDDSKLPSAPLPLVGDAVKRTLLAVPKDKLVLGISKQANQWLTAGGVTQTYLPDIASVEQRLASPGISQWMNVPYFLREIGFQDERGSHDIYYEDTASIEKKIWLAQFYGLKGVSFWYMGNYTESDWALIERK
ncbi:glycosyl hydrolase family 18 protein [Bacillus sp. 3255]|uniref:glycosyl hydrolase family 18 protein n=1 Tax=Bacillus sp. 3255 TaxID=2817904 RepID=UPI00285D4CF2|nr:glycosyl hydrolase family 18 protein [Bacillus sp. 3255]MDR6879824.1 hypothetical protein [Bacillus sp. 3255]